MIADEICKKIDFDKMNDLVPVIVQDYNTNRVLTLAYTNKEALLLSIKTGYAHYYRRTHKKVMKKGITSGNTQAIIQIITDCDNDALIFQVYQKGVACHKGEESCFFKKLYENNNDSYKIYYQKDFLEVLPRH